MDEPSIFADTTARFGLPLLYSGQAQKEVYVNEAFSLIDALLHCLIEAESASPPATPADGAAWLVGGAAIGEWAGRSGQIALRRSGHWVFVAPRDGMRVIDRSSGQTRIFLGSWKKANIAVEPTGGSIVDSEARGAIRDILAILRTASILPSA